jgi:hypothetical protein
VSLVSGSGLPTGAVQFTSDGVDIGQPVTLGSTGTASVSLATLTASSQGHTIAAVYTSNSDNFSGSQSSLVQIVNPAPLSMTADNHIKAYGVPPPKLTFSCTGWVNGDTLASLATQPTVTTTATASSHVAGNPYAITVSGAVDPNYAISYVAGAFSVTPVPLTITANNQSKVSGAPLPKLTFWCTGWVNGDTTTSLTTQPTVTTTATASSPVGNYPITVSGAVDPDYTMSYFGGTLTIVPPATTTTVTGSANPCVPFQPVTFTVTVGYGGSGTPTGTVTFEAGTKVLGKATLSGGTASLTTSFCLPGVYNVTAVYPGSGVFPASQSAVVKQVVKFATLEPDPLTAGAEALYAGGNLIVFLRDVCRNKLMVTVDGLYQGEFAPNAHLVAYGGPLVDDIYVAPNITLGTVLYGGPGVDYLYGGGGTNLIFGGKGVNFLYGGLGNSVLVGDGRLNYLYGGPGRDMLIGGGQFNWVVAGSGDSILVGNSTIYDNNLQALTAILAEWSSSDTFATRISRLKSGGGLAAGYALDAQTVVNSHSLDLLFGGPGHDWFIDDYYEDALLWYLPWKDQLN